MSTGKSKMGCTESVSSSDEAEKSSIFSRNSLVTEFLELCIKTETVKEMEGVLLKFWEKFESLPSNGNFTEIDAVCMFVLNHAYEKRSVSVSVMSRSFFAYQRQVQVRFFGNTTINPSTDCFLKELRDFKNLYTYSECEVMLDDVGLGSILDGNLGLTVFIMKFGLFDFPTEHNARTRKFVESLVICFNNCTEGLEGVRSLHPDALLHRMRHSDISVRRALLILCTIVFVADYDMHAKLNERFNVPSVGQMMKEACRRKFQCLDKVICLSTETKIIYKDIENFVSKLLSALLHGSTCRFIIESSRKIFSDVRERYNPRSLKDLVRSKIRGSLQQRRMFSEQVSQLAISDALKDYLLLQREGIWNLLEENHLVHNLRSKANDSLFLIIV